MEERALASSKLILLNDSDLDGFDDTRVRTAAYYAARWYADIKADNIDRCHLYDLYHWLIEQKPSLELVFQDYRHRWLIYYLDNFGAENGDFMGAADLQDIKLALESLQINEIGDQLA
jgi:hypothetical protein